MSSPIECQCPNCGCYVDSKLLDTILEKMVDLEHMPIGHQTWVNDMAKIKGVPHWWTGSKWQKL